MLIYTFPRALITILLSEILAMNRHICEGRTEGNPQYLFHAVLLEANNIQIKISSQAVRSIEGDPTCQTIPPRLGTHRQEKIFEAKPTIHHLLTPQRSLIKIFRLEYISYIQSHSGYYDSHQVCNVTIIMSY